MTKRSIFIGVGMALLLTVLEGSWYYVANIALMNESVRRVWKDSLLWSALASMGIAVVTISLWSDAKWWRSTAGIAAMGVSGPIALGLMTGLIRSSGIVNGPMGLFVAEWVIDIPFVLITSVVFALAIGGFARLIARCLYHVVNFH